MQALDDVAFQNNMGVVSSFQCSSHGGDLRGGTRAGVTGGESGGAEQRQNHQSESGTFHGVNLVVRK